MTKPLLPVTPETQPLHVPRIETTPGDVQLNFRVPKPLKTAFFATCDAQSVSATEIITRLMHTYCDHVASKTPRHVDGTVCPLAELVRNLSNTVIALAKEGI